MDKTIVKEVSIFFSDIVGYSSMIARDEKGALQLLDEHNLILEAHITKNNGHIIKHIGDAIFAEFSDSDLAAKTAVGIQKELKERNDNTRGTVTGPVVTAPQSQAKPNIVLKSGLFQAYIVSPIVGNKARYIKGLSDHPFTNLIVPITAASPTPAPTISTSGWVLLFKIS